MNDPQRPAKIDVALLPNQARTWRDRICIVVDVLRASSTMVVAFERGASLVIPVSSMAAGRRLSRQNGHAFCGDSHILGMHSFDMDNSPSGLSKQDLRGRSIVMYTLNGSRIARRNGHARHLLIGSLLNAAACSRLALQRHEESGSDIGIICAGNRGEFALEDFVTAGYLVRELEAGWPAGEPAPEITETAAAAAAGANCEPDVRRVFAGTWSGQWLAQHGLEQDVEYCVQTNISRMVPVAKLDGTAEIVAHRI